MTSQRDTKNLSTAYGQQPLLILNPDNTFELDKNEFTIFYGKRTWKAGATDDGQFEFKDKSDSVIFRAIPHNGNKLEIDKDLNDGQQFVFVK